MTQALLIGGIALAGIFAFTQFGKKEPTTEEKEIDDQVKDIVKDIVKEIDDLNKDLDKAIEYGDAGVIEAIVMKKGALETEIETVVDAGAAAKANIEVIIPPEEIIPPTQIPIPIPIPTPTIDVDAILADIVALYNDGQLKNDDQVITLIMRELDVDRGTARDWFNTIEHLLVRPRERIDDPTVNIQAILNRIAKMYRDDILKIPNDVVARIRQELGVEPIIAVGHYDKMLRDGLLVKTVAEIPQPTINVEAILARIVRAYNRGDIETTEGVRDQIMDDLDVDERTANGYYDRIASQLTQRFDPVQDRLQQVQEEQRLADEQRRFNTDRAQAMKTYGEHFRYINYVRGKDNIGLLRARIAEALVSYKQAQADERADEIIRQEQDRERQVRQEAQDRERAAKVTREREDKADYNTQRANLHREFPEEGDIIDATMRRYRADWHQFQGQLRSQLLSAVHDRDQQDRQQFNNAKQRIINSYPQGEGALRGWHYDPGWRDDQREMQGDAKRLHDQYDAQAAANLAFERQLEQEALERQRAGQEFEEEQVIYAEDDYFDLAMINLIAPRARVAAPVATPLPFIRTVAGTRFGTQQQAVAGWRGNPQLVQQEEKAAQEYFNDPDDYYEWE